MVPRGPADMTVLARQEWYVSNGYTRDAAAKIRTVPVRRLLASAFPRLYWLWSTFDISPFQTGLIHRFFQLWHVFLIAFTLIGLSLCRRSLLQQAALWMVPLYLTALHFIFHVEARFTLPARPFLWIYVAVAIDRGIALLERQRTSSVSTALLSLNSPLSK